jgi:TolB protein
MHNRKGVFMNTLKEPRKAPDRNVNSILETVDIETGERIVLAEFDYLIEAPNWTNDGKRLIYNSRGRIFSFNPATRESTVVDTGYANQCNNDHVLSPDNSLLAISHRTREDGLSRIYVLPLEGGNPVLLTPMAPSYLHGWSPDGSTLAYTAERNGQWDIYTVSVNGGEETQLTDYSPRDDGSEYSMDGKYIWYNSMRSGLMQIWRMNADGSEQTQMTFEESNNWFPHESPDARWVAYLAYGKEDVEPSDHPANKNVEIRIMKADGTESTTLVKLFGGQGTINVNSWSPDSEKLAFVSYWLKEEK